MRSTFLMIGERCNVAGSIIYKKAVVDGDYDKAQTIALKQARPLTQLCPTLKPGHCTVHVCTSSGSRDYYGRRVRSSR